MLWFNGRFKRNCKCINGISIHLMLWFNVIVKCPSSFQPKISIHLMLWFNTLTATFTNSLLTFQYILCCGSTPKKQNLLFCFWNFNTSYVVVQQIPNFLKHNLKRISIHLMLWFNLE